MRRIARVLVLGAGIISMTVHAQVHTLALGGSFALVNRGSYSSSGHEHGYFDDQQGAGLQFGYMMFPDSSRRIGLRTGAMIALVRTRGPLDYTQRFFGYPSFFSGEQEVGYRFLQVPLLLSIRLGSRVGISAGLNLDVGLARTNSERGMVTTHSIDTVTTYITESNSLAAKGFNKGGFSVGGGLTLGPWNRFFLETTGMYSLWTVQTHSGDRRFLFVLQTSLAYTIGTGRRKQH